MKKYTLRPMYTPENFPEDAVWQRLTVEQEGNHWVLTLKNLNSDGTDNNRFYLAEDSRHEVEVSFKECFIQVS